MDRRPPLPIDPLLPGIVDALAQAGSVVIEAPPGAGKTTRVPLALLESGRFGSGEILVLQPRRLPTRLAAQRVAEELGEDIGRRVGYSVRFEEVGGPETRLRFVTEGILTRRLLADPTLRGVLAVVLDEFHERHLAGDLGLALLRRLQRGARPDLKLVVMSATLAAEPVADYLGGAPRIRSEGRRFEVELQHLERPDERPLAEQVAGAVKRMLQAGLDGHLLIFLPGAGEIRRAAEALAPVAEAQDLLVLPLHGDLPPAEQDRAVRPSSRRKVILSTNVAETSVTIDGIAAVIDAGLARMAGHSPWSGLPTLQIAKVSQASAIQRAGRAGRTRAGKVLRLYTRHDFDGRPERDAPEIHRLDLAELLLSLHGAGVKDPRSFEWFEPPLPAALDAAESLLVRLGALDDAGALTEVGKRLLAFPIHPRLGRMVVEGEGRGVGPDACVLAALTAERDLRQDARVDFGGGRGRAAAAGSSDLLELLSRFREAEAARFAPQRMRAIGLDHRATEAVDRSRRQLQRLLGGKAPEAPRTAAAREEALLHAVLAGFPDRVARRRTPTGRELVLSGGGSARLADSSVVHDAPFVVAVAAEEHAARPGAARSGLIRLASAIEPEWLLELFPDEVAERDEWIWDSTAERVERVSQLRYGAVVLDESRGPAQPSEETARVLAKAALARGISAFAAEGEIEGLLSRLRLAAAELPEAGWPAISDEAMEDALTAACEGLRSFAELREVPLADRLLFLLTPEQQRLLARELPERVALPGGKGVKIHYEEGRPPWIESRLQDFFGMTKGPAICKGRVFLTLHLLAPNQRAVQVTRDLEGFWERHYPAIRKELSRRYPRHSWPEDGRTASPPAGGRIR
ncbi:ATP-dependent helicase HrpB [Vulgatibacter incomptus]|uniref:ATP-dependent helicase HrpB n=1 Tax=Vulgatibacter incomptus TaxID=1391653 RepID=A0A0K1PH31_9BACT|nr:ATP-dependent helicase HrpB [Vulgatibacter incomptus]AKU92817.1 ATP-dependent helicase HrpB [Vulgatibacter incomptus]